MSITPFGIYSSLQHSRNKIWAAKENIINTLQDLELLIKLVEERYREEITSHYYTSPSTMEESIMDETIAKITELQRQLTTNKFIKEMEC